MSWNDSAAPRGLDGVANFTRKPNLPLYLGACYKLDSKINDRP